MLEKGTVVYFLMNGYVMTGKVFDISGNNDNYEFSIVMLDVLGLT